MVNKGLVNKGLVNKGLVNKGLVDKAWSTGLRAKKIAARSD
ncbi:hypothetical protein IVB26_25945 [Bradyrhizobium sp. 195]|nr:hypothetical protein IVB26_25945 [Bradyrhizobium sp. 195]